jgi:signal peptidase I
VGVALPELPDDRRAAPRRYAPADREAADHDQRPVPPDRDSVQRRRPAPPGPAGRNGSANGRQHPPLGGPVPGRPLPPNGAAPGRPIPPGAGQVPLPGAPHPPVDGDRVAGRSNGRPPRPPDPSDDEPTVVHHEVVPDVPDVSEDDADPNPEVPGRHRRRAGGSADGRPAAEYRKEFEASGRKGRTGRRRRPTFWKELPLLIVVALVLTFLIQTFLAKVYVIPSGSMETTLHGCTGCNNDRVLVDKITYRFSDPQPGDVVVFRGPESWSSEIDIDEPSNPVVRGLQQFGSLIGLAPPDEKDFVKRVIAVGGQTVQCCDSRNRVLVDGQPLDEPYIYYLPEAGPARQAPFGPVTVPEGHLWMMGDSRNNSADSRVPGHGAVPVENVIGQARLIVLPFGRFGWIDAINPQTTAVGMAAADADGVPLTLGLVGVLPLAVAGRRPLARSDAELDDFLTGRRAR